MKRWIKSSKKGMAVLGAVAFMLVAGWQFGFSGTEKVFTEIGLALEHSVAGSSGLYYKDYELCSRYGYSCQELVYKCKFIGSLPCDVSGQIPCSEIC